MTPSFDIRIGNQTAAFAPSLMAPFEFAAANGFRAFEWFPDKTWTETDLDLETRAKVRQVARQNDIRLSVHAPLDPDPLQAENRAPFEPSLELTRDLGAAVFNLHLQNEQGTDAFLRALTPLIRETAAMEVILALENTPLTGPEDFNRFFELLLSQPDLPSGHVGICFDLGHANLCAATRNDYLGFLGRLSGDVPIVHLHLHENYGDRDAHLPLFTGPAGDNHGGIKGLIERLRSWNFNGSAIMEVWPEPPERLTETRDRFLALFEEISGPKEGPPASDSTDADLPSDPFAARLIVTDRKARSWREKLQGVERILAGIDDAPPPEDLATLAVYLRWLHTGRIPCHEDSRHFRPHHHAKAGAAIDRRLETWKNADNALILRRVHASLPSYDTPFTRAEPLTRIRDIAHRNDIPKELKEEIKHTLQNKLHRCAGPEDLCTSEALLSRIENGNYSRDFVREFQTFHRELEAFFNTQSLAERLVPLRDELDGEARDALERFLQIPAEPGGGTSGAFALFETVTGLRGFLIEEADTRKGHDAQAVRLAEIGLEAFAFPVLSDLLNGLEKQRRFPWKTALETLGLTLRHFEMSGAWTDESRAARREIDALRSGFRSDDKAAALRLKASLGRVRRLCDMIAERVIKLFRHTAETLGRALEVPEKEIRLFCEAELRRDLVFQLAKLNSLLFEHLHDILGEKTCEPLAPGTARGTLRAIENLDRIDEENDGSLIALLEKATGDEDLPRAVAGLILLHPVPHLSHLAVRARQAGIPFVHIEPGPETDRLNEAEGGRIRLEIGSEGFSWSEDDGATSNSEETESRAASEQILDFNAAPPVLPLNQATVERAGQKADALRRLAELAEETDEFSVPPALAVPFGVLESALKKSDFGGEKGRERLNRLGQLTGEELVRELRSLRETIMVLSPPDEILTCAQRTFGPDTPIIARSSASAEDGTRGAGTGIYYSIPNLPPDQLADGIRRVWSSLWTPKAFRNRRRAGLDPVRCGMAVILQTMETPDLSFILHSANPVTGELDEVYLEAAPGLGATLADAAEPGTPYRLAVRVPPDKRNPGKRKEPSQVALLSFCNFSHTLRPGRAGTLEKQVADYSGFPFSNDPDNRISTARRLAALAKRIEAVFGAPQDIEGFLLKDRVYLVQTRPQQGL